MVKNVVWHPEKLLCLIAYIVCSGFFFITTAQSAIENHSTDQFPLRAFYPTVKTINTETLLQLYDEAIIIDVRSQFEFDVVQINKAQHIDVSQNEFINNIESYRSKKADTPLIFYSNDPACSRSFRAATSAIAAGYNYVYAYDSGVFTLLKKAPQVVTLMKMTPAQTGRVISKKQVEKSQLGFADFKEQSEARGALVIDIRGKYHRERSPDVKEIRNIPMEALLQGITNRIWAEKKLLIFDQSGDQTQSLQYFLKANGYTDYAFLRGGVQSLDKTTTRPNERIDNEQVSINQNRLLRLLTDQRLNSIDIELILLIISKISFENHSVLNLKWVQEDLTYTIQELQQAAIRLQSCGYLLFDKNRSSLIFHIYPRLAWKGKMSGILWSTRVIEFKASTN